MTHKKLGPQTLVAMILAVTLLVICLTMSHPLISGLIHLTASPYLFSFKVVTSILRAWGLS